LLSASNLKGRNFEKIDEEGNRLNIEGRLQYKDHESHRYKDLDQENLPQGLVGLRMDNIVIKGYIFPDTATISRDTANKIVLIKGFESYTTEITEEKDVSALMQAANCGVRLLATAHGLSASDFCQRSVYRPLVENRIFDILLVLRKDKTYTTERMVQ
jgi:hypothetical protein